MTTEADGSPLFRGVGVALVTLFRSDGELDAEGSAEHAARLVDAGVKAVIVAGTTGEAVTLSDWERTELLEAVRAAVPSGLPVVAGTGAPSARQAAALTRDAVAAGADAVLALTPPGSRDLAGYYKEVAAAAADRPVLAYHYPVVSFPGVPIDQLAGLPVQGVKDSSDDATRLLAELASYRGSLYVGSAALLPLAGGHGATGAILALANAAPEDCAAAFAGDMDAHRRLADPHLRSIARSPRTLKEVVAERYGTATTTRLS